MSPDNKDLVAHLVRQTAMTESTATRVVAEILAYYDETADSFVRRRHLQLRQQGYSNSKIYETIQQEMPSRLFSATHHSERQIRRIIYG